MTSGRVARVLPVSPLPSLDRLFDYVVPEHLAATVRPGVRVKIPFGTRRRPLDGFVIECPDQPPTFTGSLSEIDRVVSPVPVLTREIWRLARHIADRQGGVASDVLRLAIPPRHARTESRWLDARAQQLGSDLALGFSEAPAFSEPTGPAAGPAPRTALLVRAGGDGIPWLPVWAQRIAERVIACVRAGRRAIVCVPDFRDVNLVEAALGARDDSLRCGRWVAGGDAGARYRQFLDILSGDVDVVVGNRSVLYAPVADLGLIVVWDDGDPLLAEPLAPYAHARDVALVRQSESGCELLIAGHTRSTAVQRLVELGWLREAEAGRIEPIIPSDRAWNDDNPHARIPELAYRTAAEALDADRPVLIQVARRGYAASLRCAECGSPARCTACGGPLALDAGQSTPHCRWCAHAESAFRCAVCHSGSLRMASPGADRTAEEIGRAFPRARVVLATGEKAIERVPAGRTVVVATAGAEPIPQVDGYGAVLLLDGELALARENLTAVEDALRQWFNAAALVGAAGRVIAVGVTGRVATALNLWRPQVLAAAELTERCELGFPPAYRVCAVTGPIGATGPLIESAELPESVRIIGTASWGEPPRSGERTILTMPYAAGDAVATALKAALMRSPQRAKRGQASSSGPHALPLRVRFDDVQSL